MHDAAMTCHARLFNGRRHALHVVLDGRGLPCRALLLRKADLRVEARCRLPSDLASVRSRAARLPFPVRDEFVALLARVLDPCDPPVGRPRPGFAIDIATLLRGLGIGDDIVRRYALPLCPEPATLECAGNDIYDRPLWLERRTRSAWRRMRDAAAAEGIRVLPISGYRSADYQARLVARKLAQGQRIERILDVSALPGYSEHHLGTTLDLHDGVGPPLEEFFEATPAFDWLQNNASRFGFVLSYPRGNRWGVAYEPWHWRFHEPPATAAD